MTPEEEQRLLKLEEKWSETLDKKGVTNLIDRLILADLLEASQEQD